MLRRKPAEDRKADIVAAVLMLSDRIGPDRLTTNDVAQAVGVTQAAIFRHFPTKAELWAAVGDVIADRLADAWQRAVGEQDTPQARLTALVTAQLRQIEATPALPYILHSRELNVENRALRDRFGQILAQYQAFLVDALQDMAVGGSLSRAIAPQDAAVLLTSLVQGLAIRWSLGSRSFALVPEGRRLLAIQLALFTGKEVPR